MDLGNEDGSARKIHYMFFKLSTAHGLDFMKGVFCQDTRLMKSRERCTQRLPTPWSVPVTPVTAR